MIVPHRSTLALLALALAACTCSGCLPKLTFKRALDAKREAIQDSVASESIATQTMEAATQALLEQQVRQWTQPAATRLPNADVGSSTSSMDLVVDFAALTDPCGRRRFAHASGSFSVHADAAVVPSWPLGSVVMASFRVTIALDRGPISYTDPRSGVIATLASGTYAYTVDSTYTAGEIPGTWTLKLDSELVVPRAAPLAVSVARPHHRTRSVSVFGARDVHLLLVRERSETLDRLSADVTYDGLNADGATVDGAIGVDPAHPEVAYTNWDLTLDGGVEHVVWNRNAHVRAHWDLAPTRTRTVDEFTQQIFLTRNGEKSGPYSALDLALIFKASAN